MEFIRNHIGNKRCVFVRCNRQTHSPPNYYLGYDLAYKTTVNLYSGYSLTTICVSQNIPWMQFDYNLHVPNCTQGHMSIGYGLAATPELHQWRAMWRDCFMVYTITCSVNNSLQPEYSR